VRQPSRILASASAEVTAESEAVSGSGGEASFEEEGPHIVLVNDLMPEFREEVKESEGAQRRGGVERVQTLVNKRVKAVLEVFT